MISGNPNIKIPVSWKMLHVLLISLLYFTKVTPEDLGEQPRTKFSNLDNDVIGDLISSAIRHVHVLLQGM